MPLQRQQLFNKPRAKAQQPAARSGVFGGTGRGTRDRSSFGLQKSRNASQGRAQGGSLPSQRTPQAAANNKRRQMFTQRVASLKGRTNTPKPQAPAARRTQSLQGQRLQQPKPINRTRQFGI